MKGINVDCQNSQYYTYTSNIETILIIYTKIIGITFIQPVHKTEHFKGNWLTWKIDKRHEKPIDILAVGIAINHLNPSRGNYCLRWMSDTLLGHNNNDPIRPSVGKYTCLQINSPHILVGGVLNDRNMKLFWSNMEKTWGLLYSCSFADSIFLFNLYFYYYPKIPGILKIVSYFV